ncbi:cyclic AMP-dependent transcription factor ATF-5 [Protopterus annectens]|uniref:cyclic AMP-dependent transcription factor ATF-5 n=1 Tax=Protopterus annectens TaxID=7888 RepID=UPI001CFAB35C|nr:cyclic AMP-dependent transcription factor ATF-5 [Protopterus annectens]
MSLLAALNLDLEDSMLQASVAFWRPEHVKLPVHALVCRNLPGLVENGNSNRAVCREQTALTGDGFTDWMTERMDFSSFLPDSDVSSLQAPTQDLETMATMLKNELEQMEDYFLEETLSPSVARPPDQVAPCTPPSQETSVQFVYPVAELGTPVPVFEPLLSHPMASSSAVLETLDSGCLELLNLYSTDPHKFQDGAEYVREGFLDVSGQTESLMQQGKVRSSRPTPYDHPDSPLNKDVVGSKVMGADGRRTQGGDRKQKKRDQNKTAALRYRQRKRAEHEALDEECQDLEAKNRELKEKAESIEREIQYVKDLLIEVYKARSERLRNT